MKKAFITGVTGQMGSYLTELLLGKGYDVFGISRRVSVDSLNRIHHLLDNPKFHYSEGDITDFSNILGLVQNFAPSEMYNCAAQSHVHTSFSQPGLTWDITAKGCLNVLEVIRMNPQIKMMHCSTSEMFGDEMTEVNGVWCQREDTPMNPQSPYAVAKLAAHKLCQLYRKSYGLYICPLIIFNNSSPRRGENFLTRKVTKYLAGLYHHLNSFNGLRDCVEDKPYPKLKLGNLKASRDETHTIDVCRAAWLSLQQNTPDDYVIGSGETHTIEEFVKTAFQLLHLDWTKYVEIDDSLFRPSEVPYLRAYPNKAKEKLGWSPSFTYKDIVKDMVFSDLHNE